MKPYFNTGDLLDVISISTPVSSNCNGSYINGSQVTASWPSAKGGVDYYTLGQYKNGSWEYINVGNVNSYTFNHGLGLNEILTISISATNAEGTSDPISPNALFKINFPPIFSVLAINNDNTVRGVNTTISWVPATDAGGSAPGWGGIWYRLFINNILKYEGASATANINLSQFTRGQELNIRVEATDGWATSFISGLLIFNDLPVVSNINPIATTDKESLIQDVINLSWSITNTLGSVRYNIDYRTGSNLTNLNADSWKNVASLISSNTFAHNVSKLVQSAFLFQYRITPVDSWETGVGVLSPIYQKKGTPPQVTDVKFLNPNGSSVITNDGVSISWDGQLSYTMPVNSIVINIISYDIQCAIKELGKTSFSNYFPLINITPSIGIDEIYIINSLINDLYMEHGDTVKFRIQTVDELMGVSTWSYTGECKLNSYPNNIKSIIIEENIVKPENILYDHTTNISITGNGDPDNQDTYYFVEIGMGKIGSNQVWKPLTGDWVAAGNYPYLYGSSFNFSSTQNGGSVNTSSYFGTQFNVNDIYDNCQVRVKIKDSMGLENQNWFYSTPFTVDYREAPSPIAAPVLNYTLANNKTGRVNPEEVVSLSWDAPSDRNINATPTNDSFSYKIYISLNGSNYVQAGETAEGITSYNYTVPYQNSDTTAKFKIVAIDRTGLPSSLIDAEESLEVVFCRFINPQVILLSNSARSQTDQTKIIANITIPDIGGSSYVDRVDSQTERAVVLESWSEKNNIESATYTIQYALNKEFSPIDGQFSGVWTSGYLNTSPPPFLFETIDGINTSPVQNIGGTINLDHSYYVRVAVTISSGNLVKTSYSNVIFIREDFPTIAYRRNQMSINKGNPENIITNPALSVYGTPTNHSNIVEIGAAGTSNAFIGFRSNVLDLDTVSGKIGMDYTTDPRFIIEVFGSTHTGRLEFQDNLLYFTGGLVQYFDDLITPPIITNSTVQCVNLNADLLDNHHASEFLLLSNYTASDILAKLKTVDGSNSGLDADTVDTYHAGLNTLGVAYLPVVKTDGIMEIGTYLDFHTNDSSDYISRIYCDNGHFKVGTGWILWDSGNDGAGSGLDADLLDNMQPSINDTASTIAQRDANGYLKANLFNTTATSSNLTASGYYYDYNNDGYIRKKTLANVRAEIVTGASVNAALSNSRLRIFSNPGSTPDYQQGQLELVSTDGSDIVLGFHRGGYTACSLKHESDGLILTNTSHTGLATFQAGNIYSNGSLIIESSNVVRGAWTKFTDGTMVQRGFGYVVGNGTARNTGTQSFHLAFYETPQSVLVSTLGWASGPTNDLSSIIGQYGVGEVHTRVARDINAQNFIIDIHSTAALTNGVYYYYSWEAWGRWKA